MSKYEGKKETVKLHILACVYLHDLCIELNESALTNWDLSKCDRRTQKEIQEILTMTNYTQARDISKEAKRIRKILKIRSWAEKVQKILKMEAFLKFTNKKYNEKN